VHLGTAGYAVVWHDNRNAATSDDDIYGQAVSAAGALAGGNYVVSEESQAERFPRLAADGAGGALVVWELDNLAAGSLDLYGRRLGEDGQPAGEAFAILAGAANQEGVTLAGDGAGRFFLSWQDDRNGAWDLYGHLFQIEPAEPQQTAVAYAYDDLYRLTGASYTGAISAAFGYAYDPAGNMTAVTETITATVVTSRAFNAANQLATANDGSGVTSYAYDANGNLTAIAPPGGAAGAGYVYDQRNLLAAATLGGQPTAEYVYDGAGNRLQQVDHTGAQPVTTTYANDIIGLTQVLVAGNGATQLYNLFGLGLISQDDGAETLTLLADGLGSVRSELAGAAVRATTTYEPYGNLLAQAGPSGTDYGFTGEQEDTAAGLLYLRARYYSSPLAGFLQRDPWTGISNNPQTQNQYTYADNSPVNNTDPSGYCSQPGWNDSQGLFTAQNCDRLEAGELQFTEEWYSDLADYFENSYGLEQAAAHFRHFLSGRGGQYRLPGSFVGDEILGIPKVKNSVDRLLKWYVRSHIDSLTPCQVIPVGVDIYAKQFTPWTGYLQAALRMTSGDQLDVAAALGTFRVDLRIYGNLHRLAQQGTRTAADLVVDVIILDVYDWNPGQSVTWLGNRILDDWAYGLRQAGYAANFSVRGDYVYRYDATLQQSLFGFGDSPPDGWVEASCVGRGLDVSTVTGYSGDYCEGISYRIGGR
ncbi:MAG: RHS repeat-associated core domain-containing protein, partial [Candidatus Promineifilaceae bacterium]